MSGWGTVGILIAVLGVSGLICMFCFPIAGRSTRPAIHATRLDRDGTTALLEGRRGGLIGWLLAAARLNRVSLTVDDAVTITGARLTHPAEVRRIASGDIVSAEVTDATKSEDALIFGLTIAGGALVVLTPARPAFAAVPVVALLAIGAVYHAVICVLTLRIRTKDGPMIALPVWLDMTDPEATEVGLKEIAACIERAAARESSRNATAREKQRARA